MYTMPHLVLVDDDTHSAHLLTRALKSHGAPDIRIFADATQALEALAGATGEANTDLLIIDLKAHSRANLDFLAAIQPRAYQRGQRVAVMTAPLDNDGRDALLEAGASAVFFRHAELDAYRREAAAIMDFWARGQRLAAVGT